jgi:putative copper export protein
MRWRWTLTGIPGSHLAIWVVRLIALLLLTIAAVRGVRNRRRALAVALFVGMFVLGWFGAASWNVFHDERSVLHSAPWC